MKSMLPGRENSWSTPRPGRVNQGNDLIEFFAGVDFCPGQVSCSPLQLPVQHLDIRVRSIRGARGNSAFECGGIGIEPDSVERDTQTGDVTLT